MLLETGPWSTRVIDTLCALKADGLDFASAWALALAEHPPRGRDVGELRPSLLDEERTPVEFLHDAARDAWYGRRPVLRHLTLDLDLGEPEMHRGGRYVA